MTLRKFDALVKRLNFNYKVEEIRVAKIQRAIFEANRKPGVNMVAVRKTPYKLDEFLPEDFIEKSQEKSYDHLLKKVEFLNMLFGGLDKRKN